MPEGIEKRKHHRFMALLEILVLSSERAPADLKLATLDVAVGGARCASSEALEPGARLQIALTLVGGDLHAPEAITIDTIVLRCVATPGPNAERSHEVVLQFVKIDPQDKRRLQSYINSL